MNDNENRQPAAGGGLPDERAEFEKCFPMPANCIWTGRGYAATSYGAWKAHAHCERWEGWQARAAIQATSAALPAEDNRTELGKYQYWAACSDMPLTPVDAWMARAALAGAALPDWIKIEGDTILIHGVLYSQALFQDFGGALPVNQPFAIEKREKDGALAICKLDWAVVSQTGGAALPTEDTARLDFLERCVMENGMSISARRDYDGTVGSPTFGYLPTVQLFTVPSQHVCGIGLRGAIDAGRAAANGSKADGR